mgnify:CR=1 FL=1
MRVIVFFWCGVDVKIGCSFSAQESFEASSGSEPSNTVARIVLSIFFQSCAARVGSRVLTWNEVHHVQCSGQFLHKCVLMAVEYLASS